MHRRDLGESRVLEVDVERLALVDEHGAVCSHVNDRLLRDLPHGPEQRLYFWWNTRNIGYRAVVAHDLILNIDVPHTQTLERLDKMCIHNLELARLYPAIVYVACVWLKTLVVSEDLRRRRGRHWRDKQTVAHATLLDAVSEFVPVP